MTKLLLLLMSLIWLVGCERDSSTTAQGTRGNPVGNTPQEYVKGEALFNARCAPCHGQEARGTNQGPPLISKIYEPSHHGDFSFHRAVQQGVQAHHWRFGNMPKIEGVSEQEVNEIIGYVRWLQRQAGIF